MSSEVIKHKSIKKGKCNICLLQIHVKDTEAKISQIFEEISNTSWVNNLQQLSSRISFQTAATESIQYLKNKILSGDTSKVTEDSGEFLISVSASIALRDEYEHEVAPISELWKEKKAGNHGYDFHSRSVDNILVFGEAKYCSSGNSHGKAFDQLCDFLDGEKDKKDLHFLEQFFGPFPIERFQAGFKSFAAAFSINSDDHDSIMNNACDSEKNTKLLEFSELYLIGVKFIE